MASRVSRYCLLIAKRYVVASFALLHLRDRIGANRSLNRILNVRYIDAPARGGFAVDGEVEVRLSDDAEDTEISDALDRRHLSLNALGRCSQACADRRRRA